MNLGNGQKHSILKQRYTKEYNGAHSTCSRSAAMSKEISHNQRRFFGSAVMTIGVIATAVALGALTAVAQTQRDIRPPASFSEPQAPPQNKLSVHWEELSAAEFRDGIARAQGVCLLPFGILEKHGLHLPLGNDLLNVRYAALNAAQQEYAIVFPEYYFGQIFEAKHQPGTVAYSRGLELQLLQETTDEMARNGCKKVIIVNGHGGNNSLLPFSAHTQLAPRHDYAAYVLGSTLRGPAGPKHNSNPATDMHAGESETSMSMIARPDLVHLD